MKHYSVVEFKKELDFFESIKAELIKAHDGKFALVKGEKFYDAFDSPDNAYKEGIRLFGQEAFLVRRISAKEEVHRNQALFLGIMNARI
jgi:hypothetical protein